MGKNPSDAILITKFVDMGIVTGRWPLVQSTRPFLKEEWPIPKFGSPNPLLPELGFVREYEQGYGGFRMIRETVVKQRKLLICQKMV